MAGVSLSSVVSDAQLPDLLLAPRYTMSEAARYVGVPVSTFATWAKGYERRPVGRSVVKQGPVITSVPRGRLRVPFIGLAESTVLAAFRRRHKMPLQRIRPAVRVLEEQIGLHHALASERLFTDGAEILYDFAERRGEDEISDLVVLRSGQHVFHQVIKDYLERITYDEEGWAARIILPITAHRVFEVDPRRGAGRPLFVHGGAPLANIVGRLKAGDSAAEVARDFAVPLEDLLEATAA